MKSVMLSIKPKWCELIASGKKTVEVRKTRPKIETPFKCYIYCTKQCDVFNRDAKLFIKNKECNGKVIGEFVCDEISRIEPPYINAHFSLRVGCCLRYDELCGYLGGKGGYGWHISDLVIYDEPKDISEFKKY